MPILSASNLCFSYGAWPVLQGVSFETLPGEFLGIIGPNGAGKTTLLKLLSGLASPREGTVTLNGENLRRLGKRKTARIIAMVPQENPLVFSFTAEEVVLMGRSPHLGRLQFEGSRDRDIATRAMTLTGTLGFAGRALNELSSGERQRVLIARALAQEPRIIFLDETTAYLDIRRQASFFNLMRRLNRQEGLTVVAVTHDINLASLFCDRVIILKEGRLFALGNPGEVITEQSVREVYETAVFVDSHPVHGVPRVNLLAGDDGAAEEKSSRGSRRVHLRE